MSFLVYPLALALAFSPIIAAGIIVSVKDVSVGGTIAIFIAGFLLMVAGGAIYSGIKGGGSKLGIGGGSILGLISIAVFVIVWLTAD